VKQARAYLKSIFDESVEQEFLTKDPSRKLKIPKNLRPKGKQVLTWEQLWLALERSSSSLPRICYQMLPTARKNLL
jgi:hypothetical protein